ncbi:MAG: 16S rRNA (guanine(527)-N(7))-methyltransferase RsmG, partial [Gammaproteobacteria bacterium]
MDALARHLDAGLGSLGLDLQADRRLALIAFLRLLHRWNRIYNLSGIRDPDAMVARHLLDSLAVLPYLYGERLLDIGSGAGIPGMVLALADPDREWVLLDRSLKKIRFLRQVL